MLAGLKTMNGQFEFFNVDFFETMGQAEHFMATEVEWDPAGLFLATSVTAVHQMENGFNMWTFQGRNLYRYTGPVVALLDSNCCYLCVTLDSMHVL